MKTTIKEITERLNLEDGWIIDTFKDWNDDKGNDFVFESGSKQIIYKKDIKKIAKILRDECNQDYENIEEFEKMFFNSIQESNDYWDIFEAYIS